MRVAGPQAATIARHILGGIPRPRHASFSPFLDADGVALDEGVALYFPAPYSYTGDDILELQAHGGPIVLNLILNRCLQLGARMANPGEFTQRAFLNDKLDLAQAEAVADLIDASSAEAAQSALRSLSGEFSQLVNGLTDELIALRMLVEALLDFPEEDIDVIHENKISERLGLIAERLHVLTQSARQGSLLREGMRVVLIGQPNVGKSSLLNRLAGQDIAIVTSVAGTTRDAIRETIHIEGVPIHVIDTAGLRDTEDEVEMIGIARTWQAVAEASVALLLVDSKHGVTEIETAIIAKLPRELPIFTVHNKIDLTMETPGASAQDIYISARTGAGLPDLRKTLLDAAGWRAEGGGLFMARARHLESLRIAKGHLEAATRLTGQALELLAEELRLAQRALSLITGEFSADDLLGEIFSRFCIGK